MRSRRSASSFLLAGCSWTAPVFAFVMYAPFTLTVSQASAMSADSVDAMDNSELCKRVLLIAASILAARKLAQYDGGKRVPATVAAIGDAVRWAEEIMREIDSRWPAK